jgi:hypothetical protein
METWQEPWRSVSGEQAHSSVAVVIDGVMDKGVTPDLAAVCAAALDEDAAVSVGPHHGCPS